MVPVQGNTRLTFFDATTRWQMASAALRTSPGFRPPAGMDASALSSFRRVTRSQQVEFFTDELGWRGLRGLELSSQMDFMHLGRSSYTTSTLITLDGSPIYKTTTTVVAVDESLQRAIPLPRWFREAVKVSSLASQPRPLDRLPRPDNAFCWQTVARWAECDELGHVNQSQYCLLLEEARAVAATANGYGAAVPRDLASAAPAKFQLNYVGQAVAGDALLVFTWWDGESFRCEMEKMNGVGRGELLIFGRFWVSTASKSSKL